MKYVVTAGGTGGHIYPAILLAERLQEEGHEVLFIATNKKLDKSILKDYDHLNVRYYNMSGFNRSVRPIYLFENLINLLKLLIVMLQINFLYMATTYDAVIGFGGYITFPVVIMAKIYGIKTSIHEQNSYPGLVNRTLAKYVDVVLYTYEESKVYFPTAKKLKYTSNPRTNLAKNITKTNQEEYYLFMGGSLGAERINELAIELAKTTTKKVKLISGERYYDELIKENSEIKNLEISAYLPNPLQVMKDAKIVFSRGGATTILEIIAMKQLAIIIPSPNVVANHQELNAQEMQKKEFIEYINEKDAKIEKIIELSEKMLKYEVDYIKKMEEFNQIDSLDLIIKTVKELDGKNN